MKCRRFLFCKYSHIMFLKVHAYPFDISIGWINERQGQVIASHRALWGAITEIAASDTKVLIYYTRRGEGRGRGEEKRRVYCSSTIKNEILIWVTAIIRHEWKEWHAHWNDNCTGLQIIFEWRTTRSKDQSWWITNCKILKWYTRQVKTDFKKYDKSGTSWRLNNFIMSLKYLMKQLI